MLPGPNPCLLSYKTSLYNLGTALSLFAMKGNVFENGRLFEVNGFLFEVMFGVRYLTRCGFSSMSIRSCESRFVFLNTVCTRI